MSQKKTQIFRSFAQFFLKCSICLSPEEEKKTITYEYAYTEVQLNTLAQAFTVMETFLRKYNINV